MDFILAMILLSKVEELCEVLLKEDMERMEERERLLKSKVIDQRELERVYAAEQRRGKENRSSRTGLIS